MRFQAEEAAEPDRDSVFRDNRASCFRDTFPRYAIILRVVHTENCPLSALGNLAHAYPCRYDDYFARVKGSIVAIMYNSGIKSEVEISQGRRLRDINT